MWSKLEIVFVAFVLALGFRAPAMAGAMEDAETAWNRQDYVVAERLYRSLAEQGRAGAQHALGKMYENGEGVPRDFVVAARWYRLAAEQGHTGAQFYLGGMYYAGEGVPRDYVQAFVWFSLSEAGGQGDFATKSRAKAAEEMTPAQIAEAERRVREWKPTRPR
jgi:TPR repeat protein